MIKLISGYLGLDYPKLMGRRLDSFRQRVHSRHIFTQNNILILKCLKCLGKHLTLIERKK